MIPSQSLLPESAAEQIALYGILRDCARTLQPKTYLEIGCREGDSLLRVMDATPLTLAVVCDIWDGNYGGTARGSCSHVRQLVKDSATHVLFLTGRSQDILPHLTFQFDMILVDGDHSLDGARADLLHSWPLLRPGGILVMDDITHVGHPYLGSLFHDFAAKMQAEILSESSVGVGAGALRKVKD